MKTHHVLAAIVLCTGALPAREAVDPGSCRRAIFFAVLEGLYRDGVSTEDVGLILRPDPATGAAMHFVPSCPLCDPALDAFHVYRSRPPFASTKGSDTFGAGLDPKLRSALRSDELAERLGAVEELLRRWVRARLDSMRLTREERSAWHETLDGFREKGMATLRQRQESGTAGELGRMKGCAICDGSAGACPAE